mmetsp:Transcript_23312/g.40485  ORF Transcript_23312/g.40485 Transcript_23312/m.40485 type:complete len:241 (+) Transcript_23312:2883-3605(+)
MEYAPFKQEPLAQRHFEGPVHCFFDRHGRDHRLLGDFLCRTHRFFDQFFGRHDAADQPCALCLFGVHKTAREVHVHRLGLANGAGQALGAADACDNPQIDLGLAKLCRIRRNDEIAHHRQFAAPAQRIAGDSGDHGLAHPHNRIRFGAKQVLGEHLDIGLVLHHLDVGAGGKRLFRAGDDDAPHLVIGLRGAHGIRHFAHQLVIEGIQRLGPVQGHLGDVVFYFDDDRLIGHDCAFICCH